MRYDLPQFAIYSRIEMSRFENQTRKILANWLIEKKIIWVSATGNAII